MVSQNSPPNLNTSKMYEFIISNSQFGGENFEGYANALSGGSPYDSFGSMPHLQSSFAERIIPRSFEQILQAPPQMPDHQPHVSHTRHLMDLIGAANEANYHAQRLSLSLGNCTIVSPVAERHTTLNSSLISDNTGNSNYSFGGNICPSSSTSYGTEANVAVSISNSKYLKPAQLLLDEVVKVGSKAIDLSNEKYGKRLSRSSRKGSLKLRSELNMELFNNEFFTDKQELHAKLLKLIALLEEAERRYEQYYNHLDELVSSFEMVAGLGAGKSYTALALQAMSKHFCHLKEAIVSQIYETKRKMTQDMPRISSDISQLSLFDQETRQNRMSLQQLGLIQGSRQAWRPIRGLPETSVAILRSWLFEHFLHP
ncbi:OLC1v1018074C3 [Oldenlandia corymbosa var. corymbosa]|nr:OLC1v1018074C3 [Oldenlandia corymbosa var. corymbosa]